MNTRPKKRNEPSKLRPERLDRVVRPCDEQEKDAARIIRGSRTRGSKKGDWFNNFCKGESKTTGKESIRVTMDMLCKITREARSDGKIPFFEFGFDGMPRGVASDWFAVPAGVFEDICGVLFAVESGDLKEAKSWLTNLL